MVNKFLLIIQNKLLLKKKNTSRTGQMHKMKLRQEKDKCKHSLCHQHKYINRLSLMRTAHRTKHKPK